MATLQQHFGVHLSSNNSLGFAGETVAWNWGSSTVEGEVAEKKAEKVRQPRNRQ